MTSYYYFYHPLRFMDDMEKKFDEKKVIPWMTSNWHWSLYVSALYLLFIWFGGKYMRTRKAFNLRRALCMWSTLLCSFSIFALMRVSSNTYQMVYLGGWRHSVCDIWGYTGSRSSGMWAFIFPFSKLPELIDTVFIVLRKQKLSFLHVFHHVSVFIYCWYSYAYPISTGIWFGLVNFTVHSIMYMYYAIKASGRNPPRWVSKVITTIQLSQMFVGIFINYVGITSLLSGKTCRTSWFDVGISVFFYVSYAILFANFFYRSYIRPKSQPASKKMPPSVTNGVSHQPPSLTCKLTGNQRTTTANGIVPANGYIQCQQ